MTARLDTGPIPYTPKALPADPAALMVYLGDEIRRLKEVIWVLNELVPQTATQPPREPREGTIRFAQDPWRPVSGQTANAWVTYVAGAWVYL